MPVALRNNKRRSLYITHNVKDFTKEALRPRSWYVPSSSGITNELADPYTSVRKLFYDFNKTAFYGDSGKDVTGSQVITNGHITPQDSTNNNTGSSQKSEEESKEQKILRESFQKLEVSYNSQRNSMLFSIPQDKNNNNNEAVSNSHPIPVSPPRVPAPKPPNFIQRTVFSSRNSDTISLKEESSSYADFYVPHTATSTPNKPSNFLRRSHKRRSFDPSKFKALDYVHHVHHVNIDDDLASLSSMGHYSVRSQPIILNPQNRIDEVVDPKPMLERYLRDTEQDICSGVYPAAVDSITLNEDFEEDDHKNHKNTFIPWNKRASFIAATYIENPDPVIPQPEPTYRRNQGRFASFRRPKSAVFTTTASQKSDTSKKSFFRRMNSLDRNTVRSLRSTTSTFRRQNSENNTASRKRRMSSGSLNKQSSFDNSSLSRDGFGHRSLRRKSQRYKMDGAQCFFDRYQDTLRVEVFSVDLNKFSLKQDMIIDSKAASSPPTPATPTSLEEENNSVFDYNYEALSKEFDYKLVGKTYQQLFYLRSRLSASARKTEFMCDGSFGCGSCDLKCFPNWSNS